MAPIIGSILPDLGGARMRCWLSVLATPRVHRMLRVSRRRDGEEKEPAHLKNGYQALTGKLTVHNGKRSDIELIHDFQGFTGTGVGGDLDDLGLHDIAYSGAHISHEPRRGYPEFTQDKLNPIIDVSTSGSDGIRHTYLPFEVSIGNGRANAIHVWVAMSDDE